MPFLKRVIKATLRNVDFDKNLESLRSFEDYVETIEYNEAYTITLDEDLFGPNIELPIQREDMEHAANLERKFLFVNPSASGTTKQLVGGSKSTLLASLLNDAENDQLVFIPHVSGFHWVLFVIDLSYPIVYYLDSLHGSIHQNLKLILSTAIKLRDNAKNLERILAWKEVECPMQPMNVECGFYDMRFMKELIANRSMLSK
ncbi:hypothetical protein Vadar_026857 [Vaccinium darrowii]|uniref:Uncharacterized protein n=1 Tax=Vaccinium darrowii TaxID=229202 RepID=A0ACB7XK62_9ERIC|nr:hypothetical protein Vadar_026857 [Vaccinium darrowii]